MTHTNLWLLVCARRFVSCGEETTGPTRVEPPLIGGSTHPIDQATVATVSGSVI
jgi:hypothetical protein